MFRTILSICTSLLLVAAVLPWTAAAHVAGAAQFVCSDVAAV
jgi:hypothetical protein